MIQHGFLLAEDEQSMLVDPCYLHDDAEHYLAEPRSAEAR
jgi:hypothetical protein